MLDTTNLTAVISVNPISTMEAIFGMQVLGAESLASSIQPRVGQNLVSSISVRRSSSAGLQASIKPRMFNDITASIVPRTCVGLLSSIIVQPVATMEATFDVVQQVPTICELYPTKDAFVRNGVPKLNYGKEEEALVGTYNGETYEALYCFSIPTLPRDIKISKAEIRLYNLNSSKTNVDISETSTDWPEYSTTWANQPSILGTLTSTMLSERIGYQSIDVSGKLTQASISLKVSPTDTDGIARLTTRESKTNKPVLYIEYLDLYPKSSGSSKRKASITVRRSDYSSIEASIEVSSHNMVENLPSSIKVPIYDLDSSIVSSITVASTQCYDMDASIKVPIYDKIEDLSASITYRANDETTIQSSIKVPIYDKIEDLNASITYRANGEDSVGASIEVPIYDKIEDLNASITYRANGEATLASSIEVPIYDRTESLIASINVRVNSEAAIGASIEVPIYDRAEDLVASITCNANGSASMLSSIKVPIYDGNDNLNASLNIRPVSAIMASISVRVWGKADLPASVKIIPVSTLDASIFVISGYLAASIIVPHYEGVDMPASIVARVKYMSDVPCYIRVGGAKAYAFIM